MADYDDKYSKYNFNEDDDIADDECTNGVCKIR